MTSAGLSQFMHIKITTKEESLDTIESHNGKWRMIEPVFMGFKRYFVKFLITSSANLL